MLENALTSRNLTVSARTAWKTAVSAGIIVLAVVLPQIVHLAMGQPGGAKWLPMYLPVLLGGLLLGTRWALPVGLISPLVSYLVTSALGSPMPAAERLPFMMVELAIFAAVSGLFSKKAAKNALWAVPAVIAAQIAGRAVFLGLVAVFQRYVSFSTAMIWSQLKAGYPGMLAQIVLVPVIVWLLGKLLLKDGTDD
jgi:hypothetical protein